MPVLQQQRVRVRQLDLCNGLLPQQGHGAHKLMFPEIVPKFLGQSASALAIWHSLRAGTYLLGWAADTVSGAGAGEAGAYRPKRKVAKQMATAATQR